MVARVLARAAMLVSIIMVVTYETDGLMEATKSGKLKGSARGQLCHCCSKDQPVPSWHC